MASRGTLPQRFGILESYRDHDCKLFGHQAGLLIRVVPAPCKGPPLRFAAIQDCSREVLLHAKQQALGQLSLTFVDLGAQKDGCFTASRVQLTIEKEQFDGANRYAPKATPADRGDCSVILPTVDDVGEATSAHVRRADAEVSSVGLSSGSDHRKHVPAYVGRQAECEIGGSASSMQVSRDDLGGISAVAVNTDVAVEDADGARSSVSSRSPGRRGTSRKSVSIGHDQCSTTSREKRYRELVERAVADAHFALRSGDTELVLQAFAAAIRLLHPPRMASVDNSTNVPMSDVAIEDLRACRQMQLRDCLVRLLDALDLKDPCVQNRLDVPLARLGRLVPRRSLHQFICKEQWLALATAADGARAAIDCTMEGEAPRKKRAVIREGGYSVDWTPEADARLLKGVAEGSDWRVLQTKLERSTMWLKNRHRQLQQNPCAPCPGRRHKNSATARVGYRKLVRDALEQMPARRGTVLEICATILTFGEERLTNLNRDIERAPSRSGREKWMNYVADELSHCRDFVKVGMDSRSAIWQLKSDGDDDGFSSPLDSGPSTELMVKTRRRATRAVENAPPAEVASSANQVQRLVDAGGKPMKLRGINIQRPWAKLILQGIKTIEARRYPLKGYINENLWLIETRGQSDEVCAGIESLVATRMDGGIPDDCVLNLVRKRRRRGDAQAKFKCRIIGVVRFSTSFKYESLEQWRADECRHCIPAGTSFDWTGPSRDGAHKNEMHAWEIEYARALVEPQTGPREKGMIGCKAVTRVALLA